MAPTLQTEQHQSSFSDGGLHSNDPVTEQIRSHCQGIHPLDARLETWMTEILRSEHSTVLREAVDRFGSPLNIIDAAPMTRNLQELTVVADQHDIAFRPYFARKANKCLTFVDTAHAAGAGIDVASQNELQQVLNTGVPGRDIICTAAIKSESLIRLCVQERVTLAIDNHDELLLLQQVVESLGKRVEIALRISGFQHDDEKLFSRFGFDIDDAAAVAGSLLSTDTGALVQLRGLHFHLDGYCASQRVSAIKQSLKLIDELQTAGFELQFLDIGGGLPMSYLDDADQWQTFWERMRSAVAGDSEPITYRNHGLGLSLIDGQVRGKPQVYPFHQSPVRADWLDQILTAECEGKSLAEALRDRKLELRCEPGRSILDGCGITVAEVQFRKQLPGGEWLIGVEMNRTQCRTSSLDFLVDPLVVKASSVESTSSMEGYVVGAYCTESELLCLRKLRFPNGVARGDLIVFPNTAGYLMHFLESRSHQFPLAKNVCYSDDGQWQLDAIDVSP